MNKIKIVGLWLLMLHSFAAAQEVKETSARLKPVYVDGMWGYAEQSGRIRIAPQFDAARPFNGGLAQVGVVDEELPEVQARPNLKWGYIDESGRVVVELRYTVLRGFSEDLAAAAVLDAERPTRTIRGVPNVMWGYVDRDGRVRVPMQFLDVGDFSEGLAQVNVGTPGNSNCGKTNYGYIDKTGTVVIKPQFVHAGAFKNGRAQVSIGEIRYVGRCLCCGPRFHGQHGSIERDGKFTPNKPSKDSNASLEGEDWENRR